MLFCIFLLSICKYALNQAVMGIDMGGQYIKVSVVTPTKQVETVLDKESNRKTSNFIGFQDGHPVFSEAARKLYRRFPEDFVPNCYELLGRRFDDPSVIAYRQANPHLNITQCSKTGGILVNFDKYNLSFTPIELFALILGEIRDFTAAFTSVDITDSLISFDPNIDLARADAVKAAAKLAGLSLLEITDSSRVVITQYLITRRASLSSTPRHIMIVDVGAVSSVVTIAQVGLENGSKPNTSIGSYNLSGLGYVHTGASNIDLCLQNFLVEDFMTQQKLPDIRQNHRVIAKFAEQIPRAKHSLTLLQESHFVVEQAYDYTTYQTVLTRDLMEKNCAYVFEKIGEAIGNAFESSNSNLDQLEEVVVMGGGSRIPAIKSLIERMTRHSLSWVLNTDEANAAGASFLAAKAHKFFRVTELKSPAFVYYPIQVEYNISVIKNDGTEIYKNEKITLYKFLARQSAKKVLRLVNVSNDFTIFVRYDNFPKYLNIDELDYRDIMAIHISGVKEALSAHPESISRHVAVHFSFDSLRLLRITNVEYFFEKNSSSSLLSKVGKAFRGLLGVGSNSTTPTETENHEVVSNNNTDNQTQLEGNITSSESKPLPTLSDGNVTFPLTFEVNLLYFPPPTSLELNESIEKLQRLYASQQAKLQDAISRNELEAAIYETEKLLNDEVMRPYFTPEEFQNFVDVHKNVSDEFLFDGMSFNSSVSEEKKSKLNSAVSPAKKRLKRQKDVSEGVKNLKDAINKTQSMLFSTMENSQIGKLINSTHAMELLNSSFQISEWLNEKLEQQNNLSITDKPVLTAGQIRSKLKALESAQSNFYKKLQDTLNLLDQITKQLKDNPKVKDRMENVNFTSTSSPESEVPGSVPESQPDPTATPEDFSSTNQPNLDL